ncbi:MAG: MMPL family transporter [Longimicrobiales bacterium]
MTGGLLRAWSSRAAPWTAAAVAVAGVLWVARFVDVSPRVEGDFFFAEDDPQMQASLAVAARFPSSPQVILRVEDLVGDSSGYQARVAALTSDLLALEGVTGGYSIATDDPASPLFGRILRTPDPAATNVILSTDDTDPEVLVPRIEGVVAAHAGPELSVITSGVPVIVELIRRSLYRDLVVFSLAAVLVFGLIIGLVYRDVAILVGTLSTTFASVSLTLILVQAIGVPIGLLTANLVTIVFVLTLSHVVFLTANWKRRAAAEDDRSSAVLLGIRDTMEGSFWSMATTLLGFLSLLLASAKPLRDLGLAGSVGTLVGFFTAYALYPAFIARWAKVRPVVESELAQGSAGGRRPLVVATAAVVVISGLGVLRVNTDPGLLTYFGTGTELRDGLEQMDRDGGSSTLDLVVRNREGGRLDAPQAFARLEALHTTIEADTAVGVALSPTVLVAHARAIPLAGLLPTPLLLDLASGPRLGGVGLGYITAERDEAHYFLRMRESGHEDDREVVMDRLRGYAREQGLEPVAVAGLYDLQAQLARLISSSLVSGIGGLLVLFLGVALIVSRSVPTALKMWVCLAGIPAVILGPFGYLGIAVDIITSPAANVALGMGADSMIHLVVRVRRLKSAGDPTPWTRGVAQIGRPVLGATGIISAGFGIFVLSTFPPTQRFGLAVILGTLAAATLALIVLPGLAPREAPET